MKKFLKTFLTLIILGGLMAFPGLIINKRTGRKSLEPVVQIRNRDTTFALYSKLSNP